MAPQPKDATQGVKAPPAPVRRSSRIIEELPPSPSMQTRAMRRKNGTTIDNSFTERKRIAKIRKTFKHHFRKPCSVFGLEREARYRGGFFFCLNCEHADNRERSSPHLYVNRFSGLYGCKAFHKNVIFPTDRKTDEKKRQEKKKQEEKRKRQEKKLAAQKRLQIETSPLSKKKKLDVPPSPSQTMEESPPRPKNPTVDTQSDDENSPARLSPEDPVEVSDDFKPSPSNGNVVEKDVLSTPTPTQADTDALTTAQTTGTVPTNPTQSTLFHIADDDDGIESDRAPDDSFLPDVLDNFDIPLDSTRSPSDPTRGMTIPQILERDESTTPVTKTNQEEEEKRKQYTVSLVNGLLMQVECLKKKLSKEGEKNATLKRRLQQQRAKNKARLDRIYYLEKRVQTNNSKELKIVPKSISNEENAEMIVRRIKEVICASVKNHQIGSQRSDKFFRMLTNMLMKDNLHGTQACDIIVKAVSKHLRDTCFAPFNLLREMDMAGGVLSLSGLELLRKCESNGKKGKHTLIPSAAAMKKAQQEIEKFADSIVPFHTIRNTKDGSEGFIFRGADSMTGILRTNNALDGPAKEREHTVASTMDGAGLTKSLQHTLGGFKYNDDSNPLQRSQAACVPTCCIIGREKKNTVRGIFSRVLKENKEAAEKVLPKAFGIKKVYNPLNADMACDMKVADKGGAVKVAKYPCAKCHISSDNLTKGLGSPEDCKWCDHMGYADTDEDWVCRHFPICTADYVSVRKAEMDKYEKDMPHVTDQIETIWKKSKIHMTKAMDPRMPDDDLQRSTITSIHFDLSSASRQSKTKYSGFLVKDLKLRKLPIEGTVFECQDRLRRQLISEWQYVDCCDCLRLFGKGSLCTALVMVMDALPCILHMEMRMGQKILTMCFRSGLANAKNNLLPWIEIGARSSVDKQCKAFLRGLQKCMNTEILGTADLAFQYEIPFENSTKTIGVVSMNNVQIRKLIVEIAKVVNMCIIDEEDKKLWDRCMQHYSASFDILKIRERLSDEQIFQYQKHADLWYRDWVELYGDDGITNYAHYIGSGHIGEYLLHWRNLTNHSQQGWEAFNSAFKSFYFNRTQRGGAVNKGQGQRSRLRPMARWIQRQMIFMLGYDLETMRAKIDARTPEEETKFRTWVKDNGSTIEFGQLVRTTEGTNDDSKNDEDNDDVNEYQFDWDVGVEILYDPKLDDTNDLNEDSDESTDWDDDYESE